MKFLRRGSPSRVQGRDLVGSPARSLGLLGLALSGLQYDTAAQELAWRWPGLVSPVLESVILASVGPLLGRGLKGPKT